MLIFLVQLVLGVIWKFNHSLEVFNHSLEVFNLNLWCMAGQEQPPPLHSSPLMSCHASNQSVSLQSAPLPQPDDDDDAPPPLPQRTPESFIVASEPGE